MDAKPSLWPGLPYELCFRIVEATTDRASLSAWSRVNKTCNMIAHKRIWQEITVDLDNLKSFSKSGEEDLRTCTKGPWDEGMIPYVE